MVNMPKILIVDDEEKMRFLLSMMLERKGYGTVQAGNGEAALERLEKESCDIVITDIRMPKMDGIGLLQEIQKRHIPVPVVFITAFATVDSAVDAMKKGAADYITKPFEEDRILLTMERTLKLSNLMAENLDLKRALRSAGSGEIVYVSRSMGQMMALAAKVAVTDAAVLISGESGTGKELLARYIHRTSPRCDGRFVPVNCAAISPNLVESELFGHEKGSFTGADRKTLGKFEYASAGTLFLDEIGDLPLEAQAKLLRALQENRIQRVGGNEEVNVDVRVICATNRNLKSRVESGAFRQDLYFRINVFPIEPPPLRKRIEDILPLAEHFIERRCGKGRIELTRDALDLLREYDWPGNVRELANAMERAVILGQDEGRITAETLDFLMPSHCGSEEMVVQDSADFRLPEAGVSLEDLEKDLVRQALEAAGDNQSAAARLLGLSRAKFRVLLKQLRQDS